MSIRGAKQNYDILFKSAVVRLKLDADVYNELQRKACWLNQLNFDGEGKLMLLENHLEMADEVQTELKRYAGIIQKDVDEVYRCRKLKEQEHETD